MTTDEQLRSAFEGLQDNAKQAQLRWVSVTSIDKEARTMEATGIADNLEYYGIQLGMGAFNVYPKKDTACLIGIVEGQETDAFLIAAEEVEEMEITTATSITINGGSLGGLVKVEELTKKMNDLIDAFNNHTHTLQSGTVNVAGSAASQSNAAPITVPAINKKHDTVKRADIENEKVKQ